MNINLWSLLLVCEIFPEDVQLHVREGKSEKTGKAWRIQTQRGYFKKPDSRFPKEFVFGVPDSKAPYPAGMYFIDPNSFDAGDFDSLELSRYDFALVPVPAEMQKQLEQQALGQVRPKAA